MPTREPHRRQSTESRRHSIPPATHTTRAAAASGIDISVMTGSSALATTVKDRSGSARVAAQWSRVRSRDTPRVYSRDAFISTTQRAATSLLYGDSAQLRTEALTAPDPLRVPHVASSLERLGSILAATAG